jgi:hypothetical protein
VITTNVDQLFRLEHGLARIERHGRAQLAMDRQWQQPAALLSAKKTTRIWA